jgi:hypothetical protein
MIKKIKNLNLKHETNTNFKIIIIIITKETNETTPWEMDN